MIAREVSAIAKRLPARQSPDMRVLLPSFTLFSAILLTGPALASASDWMESEGGAVRLVTTGLANEAGRMRGALEIRLQPGWKTYWRNPGEAGIPPQISLSDLSDVKGVELYYPPPERISDPYATWAGYKHSVTLPIVFTSAPPESAGIVEGDVMLGICEAICIPFQASFSFDAGADPDNAEHAMLVENAFASLPADAHKGFQVEAVSRREGGLLFQTEVPAAETDPLLFVAGPENVRLTTPKLVTRNGTTATFSTELLNRSPPQEKIELEYTLVSGRNSVSGMVPLPQ